MNQVILEGKDAVANEVMFKQRSVTDYILLSLPFWPDGLAIHDVPLTSSSQLEDMLNSLRGRVSTLSVSVVDVLDFYSHITQELMFWLLVTCRLFENLLCILPCQGYMQGGHKSGQL